MRSAGKPTEAVYEYEAALEGFADDNPVVLLRLALTLYDCGEDGALLRAERLVDRAVRSPVAEGRYFAIAEWAMRRIGLYERAEGYRRMAKNASNQLPVFFSATP